MVAVRAFLRGQRGMRSAHKWLFFAQNGVVRRLAAWIARLAPSFGLVLQFCGFAQLVFGAQLKVLRRMRVCGYLWAHRLRGVLFITVALQVNHLGGWLRAALASAQLPQHYGGSAQQHGQQQKRGCHKGSRGAGTAGCPGSAGAAGRLARAAGVIFENLI